MFIILPYTFDLTKAINKLSININRVGQCLIIKENMRETLNIEALQKLFKDVLSLHLTLGCFNLFSLFEGNLDAAVARVIN